MKLIIKDDEDKTTVVPIVRDEYSIGRGDRNTIRLTERNVSRNHAKILRESGQIYIQDLGSYNGVKVNGEKIAAKARLREGDQIAIGDYFIELEGAPSQDPDTNPTGATPTHVQPPADRTPPLAVPAPPPRPQPAPQPPPPRAQAPAQPPAASRKTPDGATAMIRLSDLQAQAEPSDVRELRPQEQPRIIALAGTLRGQEFALRRSVVKFGRTDDGNDLVIDHQSISRQHGRFQLEGGGWKIYDNKSANGIRVNGEEYGMSPVKAGDTIELGHVKFRVLAPGEQFQLPRETAPMTGSGTRIEPMPEPPKRTGLYIGLGVGALVLVGGIVAAVMLLGSSGKGDKATKAVVAEEDPCSTGQAAVAAQKWEEAVKQLSIAKSLAKTCAFPVDQVLENAKRNVEAKQALEDGKLALESRKWAKVVSVVKNAPTNSNYDLELRQLERDAREKGSTDLVNEINRDIDANRFNEAKTGIENLAVLDPQNTQLEPLTNRLNDRKKEKDKEKEQQEARKAATPAPAPKKSQAERNAEAEQKATDGVKKVRDGDYAGGIALLEQAIKLEPEKPLLCKTHRNLGVAYSRDGKKGEALRNYKAFLKCDPESPDREKIEKAIEGLQ